MKAIIDLEQWMLDLICEKLEGQLRYYEQSQDDDRLTTAMKKQFLAYIPELKNKLSYYKAFKLEHDNECA